MEWLTRKIIWTLAATFIAVGIAVAIWDAIPDIIKFLAVIGILLTAIIHKYRPDLTLQTNISPNNCILSSCRRMDTEA